jgi:FkbM family methyltransferase
MMVSVRSMRRSRLVRTVLQTWRAVLALAPARRVIVGQSRHGEGSYTLRASGARVHVRHRSRDLDIVNEIFVAGSYAPPADLQLSGPMRILDLGGNVGLFGAYAFHAGDVSELISYEPDPENSRLLCLTAGPFAQWRAVEAAVSNRTGEMQFSAGMHSESRMALAGERSITVSVVDLYEQPSADLIKIDIEGGEWPILADPRLAGLGARAIVMEWHQLGCPERDARACAERLLGEAGYRWQHHVASPSPANGTVWACRASS